MIATTADNNYAEFVTTHLTQSAAQRSAALDLAHVACGRLDGYWDGVSLLGILQLG